MRYCVVVFTRLGGKLNPQRVTIPCESLKDAEQMASSINNASTRNRTAQVCVPLLLSRELGTVNVPVQELARLVEATNDTYVAWQDEFTAPHGIQRIKSLSEITDKIPEPQFDDKE